jgi:hypothetical protein
LFSRPQDHYSALPNIVWGLGLTACELATYMYLIFRENRQTYRCHPSYEEIGKAIGRDKRSVPKYVNALVEKRLIEVEPTTLTLADGTRCNGTLEYHLLNPQIAMDHFNAHALSSGGLRVPKVRRTRPRREKRPEKNPVPYMAVDDEENELPL